MTDLNPQAREMADESMVRNLDAQARAIWPQEAELFRRYGLAGGIRILDAGCGTGEITSRLADFFPSANVLGVDIIDAHLVLARTRHARFGSRVRFEHQTVFGLDAADTTFDLTVCRHVLHAVPYPDRVLAELKRVTKRGGRLHLIPEDYGMLHFQRAALDPTEFWHDASTAFGVKTNTDLYIGRDTFEILTRLGLADITVDYLVVDTIRVPRETFATILEAWRDGYADSIAQYSRFTRTEAIAYFEQMIGDVRNANRYATWMVPVVAARVP
jgi:ubiquinone/menaquinone biosynthesis C-methylase UbiE